MQSVNRLRRGDKLSPDKKKKKDNFEEIYDTLANFILPNSLPCSEINLPQLSTTTKKTSWNEIVQQSDERMKEIMEYAERKKTLKPKSIFTDTESEYIQEEVFPLLLDAVEQTLHKANTWQAIKVQQCIFNGIDHVAEVLWNRNPKHPERLENYMHIFNMPWARTQLRKSPRPLYPQSWIWTRNYAATVIQRYVRQYFIQREEEVQEMRGFWRKLQFEKENPNILENPLLAKKFALSNENDYKHHVTPQD